MPAEAGLPRPVNRHSWFERTPFLLYALTGFTGLLAEQGFEKYIALLVGATASASAVVLFTYFLGFALGGVAAGRLIKGRRIARPLLVYGLIELLVGVSCVVFTYSFHGMVEALAPLQNLVGGTALRFQARFLCGCILVLPTAVLMGASFPLIACALDSGDPAGKRRWAQAYTANLGGALLAAGIAPLTIMPALGLRGSLWLCFAITGLVCVAAALLEYAPSPHPPTGAGPEGKPRGVRGIRLLLAGAFASGAVFFALEVIWTHLVGVVIGCSIYAFSWMLTAVLLGLLIGSSLVNRMQRRGSTIKPTLLFQSAALLLLFQLWLWDRAPLFFRAEPPAPFLESFYFAELAKLAVACLLLVPVSTALGLIYPALLASPRLDGEGNSHWSGYLSAANSLSCLTGALLAVFVMLPLLGSELSLKVIALAVTTLWLLFLLQERPTPRRLRLAGATALCVVAVLVGLHWNLGTLTAGNGNYFGQRMAVERPAPPGVKSSVDLVFHDESVQGGLTTVLRTTVRTPHDTTVVRTMFTNGKFEGDDDSMGQMNAQFGLSAIPSLFVSHFDRALLIGLGTGHTGAALKHLGYGEIDIAEFAPGIVAAARQSFAHLNNGILDDPHTRLFLEDGRNVLLTNRQRTYDLITIEITNVWFAGATNLYSREFYELARKRLKPDGVLQQWVQLHHIGPHEVACELATVRAVFPYVGLWIYGAQGMMVASDRPLVLNPDRRSELAGRFRSAPLVDELYRSVLVSPSGLNRLIQDLHPGVNTDHSRWLEYSTPRYQSSSFDWLSHNIRFLSQYRN